MTLQPIGVVHSCYKEKFGIPRQPRLVTEARAELHLLPHVACADTIMGLEQFSHIWLLFGFHQTQSQGWKPLVRPPRLGGQQRLGVFATRSMFRPNPLGLSAVRLLNIQVHGSNIVLMLGGVDVLDGTPVFDIKPYIPYADAIAGAEGGFAATAPVAQWSIVFSDQALAQCQQKAQQWQVDIALLIEQILQQDPRPAYRVGELDERCYAMKLFDFDVRWHYQPDRIEVLELVNT